MATLRGRCLAGAGGAAADMVASAKEGAGAGVFADAMACAGFIPNRVFIGTAWPSLFSEEGDDFPVPDASSLGSTVDPSMMLEYYMTVKMMRIMNRKANIG